MKSKESETRMKGKKLLFLAHTKKKMKRKKERKRAINNTQKYHLKFMIIQ
jgi:hypothetical protein